MSRNFGPDGESTCNACDKHLRTDARFCGACRSTGRADTAAGLHAYDPDDTAVLWEARAIERIAQHGNGGDAP